MTDKKEFLKNPFVNDVYKLEIRFDFDKIKDYEDRETNNEILKLFSINKEKLRRTKEDYLENYFTYEEKKLFLIEILDTLIIKIKESFILLSLNRSNLEATKTKINKSSMKNFIQISDIDTIGDINLIKLMYPPILEKYITSLGEKVIVSTIYDRIIISIHFYKLALKERNDLYFYISFVILASVLEHMLYTIATKENISLESGFSIGSHIKALKGRPFLVTQHPNGIKSEDGKKKLTIYYESSNQTNIFTKQNKDEGKRIIKLLDEVNRIRTNYIHYTSQEPNNPSDCLLGIIDLGQFMIWCEENGYV